MLNDRQYTDLRRPQLLKVGMDPRSIDYLISLERGTAVAIITAVAQLTKTASWEGRRCKIIPANLELVYQDGLWRINA